VKKFSKVHFDSILSHRAKIIKIDSRMSELQQGHSSFFVKFVFFGPIANLKGHYFQPSLSVCLSVCVSLTITSTLQRWPILMKLGHKDPTLI